jgi:hypothetical protein
MRTGPSDPSTDETEAHDRKMTVLCGALDVKIAELDAGRGVEVSIDEFRAESSTELGLDS